MPEEYYKLKLCAIRINSKEGAVTVEQIEEAAKKYGQKTIDRTMLSTLHRFWSLYNMI
jgi:hypothetical protein